MTNARAVILGAWNVRKPMMIPRIPMIRWNPQSGSEAPWPIAPITRKTPSTSTQAANSSTNTAIVSPGYTKAIMPKIIAVLVLLFAAWVLVDGVFRVIGAIGHRASNSDWGFNLIIGIVGIIIGFLTFHAPG